MTKKLIKKLLFILLIFLAISAVFSLFQRPFEKADEISLSELVRAINQEEVKEVTVAGNKLEIVYADGEKASSVKEEETAFSQSLINYGVQEEKLALVEIKTRETADTLSWLLPLLLILPLLVFGFFFFMMFRQAKSGAMQAFDFTKAKAKLFGAEGHSKEKITFEDVAGAKEAKEELKEVVDFLKNPRKFLQMGARIPKGVLLTGMPGTGKTLLARAVAGEANVPFFSVAGSEFIELFVGVGSGRVRSLFQEAKKRQPCIVYIDELDAIGRVRGTGIGGGHDEREQTLNQILVEMDGFEQDSKIVVLSSTNRPDVLDPALLRPGRFDRKVVIDLPDINDREQILKIHSKNKPLTADANLREVAERTPGLSGADLANLVNEAAILAARKNKTQVHQEELLESIEKVMLGPERRSHILSKKEKEIAAFHEAGHALVAASLPGVEPVRKISIIARGMAAGYTLKVPKEDRKMMSKKEFLAEIATLLGGFCAEKIKFGDITTGASNDLEKASALTRKLVKEYGMSSLGPISFGDKEEMVFLGKEISEQRNYSEKVASQIDQEVKKIIHGAEQQAKKVLTQKKKTLENIAQALIDRETIEKEEFEEMIKGKSKKARVLPKKKKSLKVRIKRV